MRDGAVVARRAHNPKVVGSSPAPATQSLIEIQRKSLSEMKGFFCLSIFVRNILIQKKTALFLRIPF